MWEIYSLAQSPYFDIEDKDLIKKLQDGYRMGKPEFASQEIYDMMMNCWNFVPETRPTFDELEKRLGGLMQDAVKNVRCTLIL